MRIFTFTTLLGAFLIFNLSTAQSASKQAGTVVKIRGPVLAVQDAVARPLKAGDKILIGDYLSTGGGSRLEIKMIDDGRFMLGAHTSFSVEDYTFGEGLEDNAILHLLNGVMDGVSGQIAKKRPQGMQIVTSSASIGIRGTKFFIGEIDGKLHVTHWSGGGVHVKNHAGEVFLEDDHTATVLHHVKHPPTPPQTWDHHQKEKAKKLVRH